MYHLLEGLNRARSGLFACFGGKTTEWQGCKLVARLYHAKAQSTFWKAHGLLSVLDRKPTTYVFGTSSSRIVKSSLPKRNCFALCDPAGFPLVCTRCDSIVVDFLLGSPKRHYNVLAYLTRTVRSISFTWFFVFLVSKEDSELEAVGLR